MCYWGDDLPIRERVIPEDKAIVAYKRLHGGWNSWDRRITAFGSPHQYREWRGGRCKSHVKPTPWPNTNGIFCFKSYDAAYAYHRGSCVVKLRIWGTVLEYGESVVPHLNTWGKDDVQIRYAGFRAEYAKIDTVYTDEPEPHILKKWKAYADKRGWKVVIKK